MSQPESPFGSRFADQLTIDTPEQVELRLSLASAGSRLLAILADSLLQGAVAVALFVILFLLLTAVPPLQHAASHVYARSQSWSGSAQKWLLAALILVQFLLFWGYFSLFEAFWNGQTPGKRLLKIRVIEDSGRPITLFESLARNLLRVIDMLPSIYLVGLVAMLCNRQGKRLGDLLAGTLVVHESGSHAEPLRANLSRMLIPDAAPAFFSSQAVTRPAGMEALPADAVRRLQPADLHVLETFFARHLDLSLAVRHAMALRIAAQLTGRMQWAPPDVAEHPERLLEALLFALRER